MLNFKFKNINMEEKKVELGWVGSTYAKFFTTDAFKRLLFVKVPVDISSCELQGLMEAVRGFMHDTEYDERGFDDAVVFPEGVEFLEVDVDSKEYKNGIYLNDKEVEEIKGCLHHLTGMVHALAFKKPEQEESSNVRDVALYVLEKERRK